MTYSIGQFARLGGVTAKTLRFYDEIGLLRPSAVDARTRYRRYGPEQLPRLAAILALREMGVPLAKIEDLVRHRGPTSGRRRVLERVRELLATSLEETQRSLAWVEAELEEASSPLASPPILLRRAQALPIASLRAEVASYSQIQEVERALYAAVPEGLRGLRTGVVWHRCADGGTPDGEAFVELRAPLPAKAASLAGQLPVATLACAYTDGGDAATQNAYAALRRWARARRYRLTGVAREVYLGPMLEVQLCIEAAS